MTAGASAADDVLQFVVREEAADDAPGIDAVTRAAFLDHPHSEQTEHLSVRDLRAAGALRLSLVATLDGVVVGHLDFSPVTVGAADLGWWEVGPLSVLPARQRQGIGSALLRSGLRRLAERQVAGCVVLGDSAWYGRFGFASHAGLVYPGARAGHFMALALQGVVPTGEVAHGAAIAVSASVQRFPFQPKRPP